MKVVVTKPLWLAGTVAVLNGNRFRYPGQNFWVQPVLIKGKNHLITEFKEIKDEDDNMNEQEKIVLNDDPIIIYDYQSLLFKSYCPSCKSKLKWKIKVNVTADDDRFCRTECCGTVYSMVPEKVRVVAVSTAILKEMKCDYDNNDFIKELVHELQRNTEISLQRDT